MLGVNQLDFINYTTALKGNYRKGVHKLEAILANPTHAAEFAANLGGVSVVLGVPIGREDKNSETLLSLLLASSVADAAVYTWLGQFYEFTSWEDLLGDAGRCQEMMADPLVWRAVAGSNMAVGKAVATIAGLDYSAYADMTAVAASSTAMAAVAASSTAMAAVATSSTAMTAVGSSATARSAVAASTTAMTAICASSKAVAKYATGAAGLDPASYADMTAVAASSAAMSAVAASATAATAVAEAIQSVRSTLIKTLDSASNFTKATKRVGDGNKTVTDGLGTATIYIPTSCYDDNDTDFVAYYQDTSKSIASIARHDGSLTVSSGVSIRGVKVVGTGSSQGYFTFNVYTAK